MELNPELLSDEHDLSDEQIEQLLKQAEVRLRSEAQSVLRIHNSIPRAPKIDSSLLPQPYIQSNDQIARADCRRLIDDKDRKLAGAIRKVEDPVALRRKKLEVWQPMLMSNQCL